MKRTLVTTLTVVGVLGTGGIAMAGVLDGPARPSVAPNMTASTLPTSTTVPVAPAGPSTLVDYQVGEAGVVRIEVVGSVARVVGTTPNAGWTATIDDRIGEVEVDFVSATTRIEFEGSVVGGQFVPRVERYALTGTTESTDVTAVTVATSSSTPDTSATGSSVPSTGSGAGVPVGTAPSNSVPGATSTTTPSGSDDDDDDRDDDRDDRDDDRDDDGPDVTSDDSDDDRREDDDRDDDSDDDRDDDDSDDDDSDDDDSDDDRDGDDD